MNWGPLPSFSEKAATLSVVVILPVKVPPLCARPTKLPYLPYLTLPYLTLARRASQSHQPMAVPLEELVSFLVGSYGLIPCLLLPFCGCGNPAAVLLTHSSTNPSHRTHALQSQNTQTIHRTPSSPHIPHTYIPT